MSFGSFNSQQHAVKAEINVVPLVDVMLVLLVIFIITAPLLTHSVKIDLPKASSNPNITKPVRIDIHVKADGDIYWAGTPIEKGSLDERFAIESKKEPQPEIQILGDRSSRYENVAVVLAAAARNGITKLGFPSDPTAD